MYKESSCSSKKLTGNNKCVACVITCEIMELLCHLQFIAAVLCMAYVPHYIGLENLIAGSTPLLTSTDPPPQSFKRLGRTDVFFPICTTFHMFLTAWYRCVLRLWQCVSLKTTQLVTTHNKWHNLRSCTERWDLTYSGIFMVLCLKWMEWICCAHMQPCDSSKHIKHLWFTFTAKNLVTQIKSACL